MKFGSAALAVLLATSMAAIAYGQDQAQTPPRHMRIRIGGNVQMSKLVHKVTPVYPPVAKAAGVQGTVVLHAIIATDGTIEQLSLVSGNPLLVRAAIDAVKDWRYEPTLLNGEPVEVDTTIQVVFSLTAAPSEEAQPHGKAALESIDPQLKADILRLFDVMHLKSKAIDMGQATFQSLRPALLPSLPQTPNREKIADEIEAKVEGLFATQEFVDRYLTLYAKYLSDDDVKALIDFYQTPAGQHFNAVSGQLTASGAQVGQVLARGHLPDILQSVCMEYPELRGAADFCPSESPEKNNP
jgi:TonB family protein